LPPTYQGAFVSHETVNARRGSGSHVGSSTKGGGADAAPRQVACPKLHGVVFAEQLKSQRVAA